ncbi:TIM barrel protein [Cellulosimicrobium marinum]|uniref:TIM barrel protein n=1 Tax=Cellulosimicrobium marinum TaxID=1638992 RepID=UPI001E3087C9|nr:TIM barrel protein [Cellulosimicrobium marinum]MCB7135736.1 TIM barrel protein [Cellulosimicrobium marinum]
MVPLTISASNAAPAEEAEAVADEAGLHEVVDWNDYEKVLLSKNTGEPIDLAVLPDSRVLHTARDGVVRLTDTATGRTTQIADLDVYSNSEDGLQGISLDPNFEENNYLYMVYAPRVMDGTSPSGVEYPETTPTGSAPNSLPAGEDASYWDRWLGYNVLSRFTWDPSTSAIDLSTEREIIKVDAQRGQCCHVGADMAWDAEGNLFLSTGDNTPASTPGANGYAPNNNAPGMNPGFDARRGAGNTNDLRGKILRINPIEDLAADTEVGPGSTYTIPAGNLFDDAEQADLVREEIYVTGVRNPFRIDYDLESGALVWGDYGPDAGASNPDRGPMGYVEWQLTTEPMNSGWPYCHGPNANYNEWDFATATPGEWFDCEAGAENNSTWNTGLDVLPPATAPQVYYGDNPGDQPEVLDPLVELGGGGQAPMGGPIYRFDENLDSDVKFPEHWDGKPFMAEFSQDYVVAFTMDELSSDGEVTAVEDFLPNGHLQTVNQPIWDNVMDMEFGPDGALYVLEYGDGFFRQNPDAGLYKVTYGSENTTPRAFISADPISGSTAPLEVTFDASATTDAETPNSELVFDWDFDADGEYDAQGETVTNTFTELGRYNVQLRVTDPEGNFGLAIQAITVGNTAPEITLDQPDGGIFNWGDAVEYVVSVEDAEDGSTPSACRNIQYTFGLGHNTHAHPEVSGRAADVDGGCGFTIQTSADAVEHGEGEKIYGTLVVTYADRAQGEVPSITGEATHILKPETQQAEWFDAAEGVEVVDDAAANAGAYVTSLDEGDSFSYAPIALHHAPTGEAINEITVRGSGEGTVSLGWTGEGAEATEPLADFEFTGTGWADVTQWLSEVPEGSGSIVVTSTGGVDVDQLFFTVGEAPVEPVTVPVEQVSIGMFSLIPWVNEAGLPAVLERLAEIGFVNIEPFGGTFSGYTAEEFKALADSYGLSIPSSHYNTNEATFDTTLEFVETLGQEYVGSGGFASPGISTYENTLATAETMNRLGQRSVDAGVGKFFGHNHDNEFRTTYEHEGETLSAWEILVRETDPELVTFQVDVAWAAHAGVDVVELLEEYGDRIELLHIKDGTNIGGEGRPTFTNLGDGEVPLQDILAKAKELDIVAYYVLEYDVAPQGEDFAVTGFEYLTGLDAGGPTEPITVPVDQVSIQMFSLTPWVNQIGLPAVLERLSEIGFTRIEPFGGNFAGYTAEEFKALADSYGLSVKSSHYNTNEATFDATLDFVKTLGQEYVGSGGFASPGISTYENTLATAETMNRLGQRSVEAGVGKFFGHNHDNEFRTTYEHEGETLSAWEILVRETNPEYVTFQLDVAWAAHAGVDVVELMQEYGDRIELLHVKDATNVGGEGRPTFTNLGDGEVPLQDILAEAQEQGIVAYYVMEYDRAADGESFATTGFEYLTGLEAGENERTVTVTSQARCLAGKAYLAVRALNDEDVPLDITIQTPYGSRTFEDVAPGANAYQAFNTRGTSFEAGSASVTATDAEGGTATVESEYAASSCG